MLITSWILPRSELKNGHSKLVRTTSQNTCIPAQLQTTVPDCALECLRTFVFNNYSNHACSATADLTFLCKNPTFSGLTIGEGSLQCVVSNCFNFNAQTQSGYTICDGMADAIPNLAGTITATISVIDSLTASEQTISSTPNLSFPAPSATATELSTLATSSTSRTAPGETISLPPYVTPTSSFTGLLTSETPPYVVSSVGSTTERLSVTSTTKTTPTPSASSGSRTSSITSTTESASTSTGTSAAVTTPTEKTLSISAIAGIATASVVVIALVLGYLAYYLIVKRKAKKNRRSQRLSKFFPPIDDNDATGPGSAAMEQINANVGSPERRFYAGEIEEPRVNNLVRQSAVDPSNIGVAVAHNIHTGQEYPKVRSVRHSSQPYLTLFPVQRHPQGLGPQDSRRSVASSLEDDLEAQTQDVPILGSPKSRSSARSFASSSIPKPAPLRLSKINASNQKRNSRIALTPVYDNGYFDPTIRHVPSDTSLLPEDSDGNARKQVAARSAPRADNRPFWSQNRQTLQRFPIKIAMDNRKRSEPSSRSVSVYTEIEEDDTPEKEEDKRFSNLVPVSPPHDRTPLRDLAWPQIPRSASIAKQAEKPHSPRKVLPIRRIDSEQLLENMPTRTQEKPPLTRNEISATTIRTESSESPVFPLPPSRNAARVQVRAKGELMRQISDAYKAASSPLTTKGSTQPPTEEFGRSDSRSSIRRPGQTYQSISRLRTGRPIPQGTPWSNIPPPIPIRSPLRARAPPFPVKDGGWNARIGHPDF